MEITGPQTDVHSGEYGGAVTNPATVLAKMLASIVDERGRIRIPRFYDGVKPISEQERSMLGLLPFDEQEFYRRLGVSGGTGESGFTVLERLWTRPSFDISGLSSGYQGEGAKTIIPRSAVAKFSFRLVPDQDPARIAEALQEHLGSLSAGGKMKLTLLAQCPGAGPAETVRGWMPLAGPSRQSLGCSPVFYPGGRIYPDNQCPPSCSEGICPVERAGGQEGDNPHGPNERFSLIDFHRGIRTSTRLWDELSRVSSQGTETAGILAGEILVFPATAEMDKS